MAPRRKVVLIMSLPHSGSSLVQLILGSHPQVFGLGELTRLYKILNRPYEGSRPRLCRLCEGACPIWDDRASLAVLRRYFSLNPRLISAVLRRVSQLHRSIYSYAFAWAGKDILVDSSKGIGWIQRQLGFSHHWRDTEPLLLFITRDGRALVNSALHRSPGETLESLTHRWKQDVEPLVNFYQGFPAAHKATLSYEGFAANPERETRRVCQHLGVEFEPRMLEYWRHDHHVIDGNIGTRSLILRYRAELGEQMHSSADLLVEKVRAHNGDYYDRLGLAIRPDLRWKTELTSSQLEAFQAIVGSANDQFAYDEVERLGVATPA